MNKFSFIQNLLEHEKFNLKQKERFLKLVSKELDAAENIDKKVLEDIRLIKEKIGLTDEDTELPLELKLDIRDFVDIIDDEGNDVDSKAEDNNIIAGQKALIQGLASVAKPPPSHILRKAFLKGLASDAETPHISRKEEKLIEKPDKAVLDKSKKPKPLHKPEETKNFLALFNTSESLKFLTHSFNGSKREYNKFIESCKNEFQIALKEYKNVPDQLARRIEEFAFSEKAEWFIRKGNEKIYPKKGWGEKSFVEWYKTDINQHPKLDSKWNNEMIIPFKETIEVKAGSLPKIIEEAIDLSLGTSKSNFSIIGLDDSKLKEAEFYTDVDKLKKTLFLIFSTIREIASRNLCFEFRILYENETITGGKFKKIIITHVGSLPSKNADDPAFAKADLKSIQNNLWGLCNYEITGKFSDGFRKRIFLTDDVGEYKNYVEPKKSMAIESKNIEGFSHILKFY